jgi:hypothetical protein
MSKSNRKNVRGRKTHLYNSFDLAFFLLIKFYVSFSGNNTLSLWWGSDPKLGNEALRLIAGFVAKVI